ncbi:MAG TPA: phage tail protein [Cryomorphaceae bacterium]|nr:phage tail protein [Owenweeksia sp.]MBF98969.1 phage tail protein [Owenweeksia sp.]HAD96310.1 phage tail protein [Cryomorphaceae bacterium]
MPPMKTPGVYIVEKDAFPNSVVEVATAVPAFIGYTERAENVHKSLLNKPFRITSLVEYIQYFGEGPVPQYELSQSDNEPVVTATGQPYIFYNALRFFFQNGGGPCYIISVGNYTDEISLQPLQKGIKPLEKEQEPTMLVIPEAVKLQQADCYTLQENMLDHCGEMESRVAILDIYQGYLPRTNDDEDVITAFRDGISTNHLSYGATYYPWLHTTIVSPQELDLNNLSSGSIETLQGILYKEFNISPSANEGEDPRTGQIRDLINSIPSVMEDDQHGHKVKELSLTLTAISPTFSNIMLDIQKDLNFLPPASAMAGVYTMVDNNRGVWKAPANVSLSSVIAPSVNISHAEQEDLNTPLNGKAVNALRTFIGEGILVWGARTLDGNSNDWRYINVRRTMIMLEQSIKAACQAYVFEPNVANTWITIKGMIENFLSGIWKQGGLAGAKPNDAYSVSVGLGSTMTSEDILEGIMRVTVLVAISRPAEFIEMTFQQQMQKS